MTFRVLPKRFDVSARLFFSLGIFLFLTFLPSYAHAAFGISPSIQEIESILQGTIIARKVMLTRANPVQDDTVRVVVSGPNKDAVIGASEFVLSAGMEQVPYYFNIATAGLPVDETLSAKITFYLTPPETVAGGSTFALALSTDIFFRVTREKIENLEIKQMTFSADKKDGNIEISYLILNNGNIQSKPDRLRVTITDQKTLKEKGVIEIARSELPMVSAFESDNVFIDVEHNLGNGIYFIEAELFKNNELLFRSQKSALQVLGAASIVTRLIREPSFQYSMTVFVMGVGGLVWLRKDYRTLR